MNVGIESSVLHVALGKHEKRKRKELDIFVPFENSGPEHCSTVVAPEADIVFVNEYSCRVMATGSSKTLEGVCGELKLIKSGACNPHTFLCTSSGNVTTQCLIRGTLSA